MPNKKSTKLIYSPNSNGNVVFTGDIVNSYVLFLSFIVTPSSPGPSTFDQSSLCHMYIHVTTHILHK